MLPVYRALPYVNRPKIVAIHVTLMAYLSLSNREERKQREVDTGSISKGDEGKEIRNERILARE